MTHEPYVQFLRCTVDPLLITMWFTFSTYQRPPLLTWINFDTSINNLNKVIICPITCVVKWFINSETSMVPPLMFANVQVISSSSFLMDVRTYPGWDQSDLMFVKETPDDTESHYWTTIKYPNTTAEQPSPLWSRIGILKTSSFLCA